MTIRSKLMSVFTVFSILAVLTGSSFVLQQAISEKSSYVKELNSLLVPQLRAEVDQRLRNLTLVLNQISLQFSDGIKSKNEFEKKVAALKAQETSVSAIVLIKPGLENLVVQLNDEADSQTRLEKLLKTFELQNQFEVSTGNFSFIDEGLAIYRSSGNLLVGLVFNSKNFLSLFESSRGKDSFIFGDSGRLLFSSNESQTKSALQVSLPNLNETGANIMGVELNWPNGKKRSAYIAKLELIENAYVMIVEDKLTWLDLAAPLIKSTLSVIIFFVLIAFLAALWLSASLAAPIEELTDAAAKVGLGEWKKIVLKASSIEIAKLKRAFNSMIENLQKREYDLKIANTKLVRTESLAAVGRIGAGVAHEVKNPLASILSYAQLSEIQMVQLANAANSGIASEKLEKVKNYNKLIMDDTRRASRIINDLLTFARQKEIQTEKVSLDAYATELKDKLAAFCVQNGIDFEVNLKAEDKDFIISIDKEQIYQVIYNLVQNAVHALQDLESQSKKIELSFSKTQGLVEIAVQDNGPGIKPEHLDKIFEPFFSTKKMGQGSGLGLAICYGIMQLHGGQIQVTSELAKGTKFKLSFPIEN